MKINKEKLQKALLHAGCSTRNAEVFARHLMSEDIFEDEKKKSKIKNINEVKIQPVHTWDKTEIIKE